MADEQTRTIPHHVMALHYQDKANALEGMAITRLADKIGLEVEVARCHELIKKLNAELQAANEKIATLEPSAKE